MSLAHWHIGTLYNSMPFVSFHIDGAERTGRAEVLTSAASDATLGVYNRYFYRFRVGSVRRHHADGVRGAMAGTVAALYSVGQGDAVLLNPYGVTYLDG